ncbi:hypothetical protein TNCV_3620801 [Trichonephila clavipes]|nr:hypothetical protein TNCV_3620801 [Trichonephila clavipes]
MCHKLPTKRFPIKLFPTKRRRQHHHLKELIQLNIDIYSHVEETSSQAEKVKQRMASRGKQAEKVTKRKSGRESQAEKVKVAKVKHRKPSRER